MAVKLKFTEEFCASLSFDAMVVSVSKNGIAKVQRDHGKHSGASICACHRHFATA